MDIAYQEFMPSAQLAPYVECYWLHTFTGMPGEESPVQRCLPLGMIEVLIHPDRELSDILLNENWHKLPRAFFHGIYNQPVYWKIKSPARIFGMRFKPEMLLRLFNVPAASLYCCFKELEEVLGQEVSGLANAIYGVRDAEDIVAHTNLFLSQRLTTMKQERNYVAEAAGLIRSEKGNITIEEVSSAIGISMRQLQRSFKEATGTTPKTYLRIIRFRNALAAMRNNDVNGWCDLSYSLGYADQAHFIREFREFAGDAPGAVIKNTESFHKLPFFEFTENV